MEQTLTEKLEQLERLDKQLKNWVGWKSSLYWRLETERTRILLKLPRGFR